MVQAESCIASRLHAARLIVVFDSIGDHLHRVACGDIGDSDLTAPLVIYPSALIGWLALCLGGRWRFLQIEFLVSIQPHPGFWCRVSDANEFRVQRPPAYRGLNESETQGTVTEEEFNQAVAENFAKLVRTAEAVLGCEDSAKDSVQQAVVRVWKNIGSFDPKKGAFVTLLHVAVKLQAISHQISRKRRLTAMERFWGEIIPERPRKADPRMERLMEALGELPEKKQAILREHFFEGKGVTVMAKELGLSRAAMNSRIQTLKGALLHKRSADWEDQRSASLLAVKHPRDINTSLYRAPPRSASVPNEIPILLLHRRNDDGAEEFSNEVHDI